MKLKHNLNRLNDVLINVNGKSHEKVGQFRNQIKSQASNICSQRHAKRKHAKQNINYFSTNGKARSKKKCYTQTSAQLQYCLSQSQ